MISNLTPQRSLRGHLPARPTARIASGGHHQAALAHRLTSRDRWLARMLYEHRVLTSQQIAEIAFPSIRSANHRLLDLYRWRVLDRFQPFTTTGTMPMHYVLDVAGAATLAFEDGIDPPRLAYRHERAVGIAYSLRLAHDVAANGIFTSLISTSRQPNRPGELTMWWSAARCASRLDDIVRPDGYGRWRTSAGTELEWFLEFDFGTEAPRILAAKLAGYHQLARTTGFVTPILICFPSARRENTVRTVLAGAHASLDQPQLVPVATSCAERPGDIEAAAGPSWLPLIPAGQRTSGRVDFAELSRVWPTSPRQPTATNTVAPEMRTAELAPPRPLPPGHGCGGPR